MNKLKQDMESWAKSMNKKKEIKKPTVSQPIASITNPAQPSGFVEVKPQGFAPIEKTEDPIEQERPLKDSDDTSSSNSSSSKNTGVLINASLLFKTTGLSLTTFIIAMNT